MLRTLAIDVGGTNQYIDIDKNTTFSDVKQVLASIFDIPIHDIYVTVDGVEADDKDKPFSIDPSRNLLALRKLKLARTVARRRSPTRRVRSDRSRSRSPTRRPRM